MNNDKMINALVELSENWNENWDVIVDFFGEELATKLNEAISEAYEHID